MGGSARARVVLVVAIAATGAVVACDEDSSPGGGPSASGGPVVVDGGVPPGTTTEAGPPVTPPKGTGVTVTVHVAGAPAAGMDLFLHDESGAVTGQLKVDANGVASAPVAPKQITVLLPGGPLTYTDVEEGDALVLDVPGDPDAIPPAVATLSVTAHGSDAIQGGYAAMAGNCMGSGAPDVAFDIALRPACVNGSKTTVLGIAYGGALGVQYQFVRDVGVPANGGTKSVSFAGDASWNDESSHIGAVRLIGDATNASSSLDFFYGGVRFGMGLVRAGSVLSDKGEEYVIPAASHDSLVAVDFAHPGQSLSRSWMATRRIVGTDVFTGPGYAYDFRMSDALSPITEATATIVGDRLKIEAAMAGASSADLAVAQVTWRSMFEGAPDDKWTFVMSPKDRTWTSPALPPGFPSPAPGTELEVAFAYFDSSVGSFTEAKGRPLDPSMTSLHEPRMKDTSVQANTKLATVRLSIVGTFQP